jgi:hypothetical protein
LARQRSGFFGHGSTQGKCKETTQDQEQIMTTFADSTPEETIRLVREATKSSAPLDSSALIFCSDIVHKVSETA